MPRAWTVLARPNQEKQEREPKAKVQLLPDKVP